MNKLRRIRGEEHEACVEQMVVESEEKRSLGRPRCKCEDMLRLTLKA
jgi:hypothetical protein